MSSPFADHELVERRRRRERAIAATAEPAPVLLRRRWVPGTAIYVPEVDPR